MLASYHNHTYRCGHATGTEREYVEEAIKAGYDIFGFSDHSVQYFKDGHVSGLRMRPDQVDNFWGAYHI